MILSDLSVKRPVFAGVVSLLLVVFGVIAFTKLPVREMPRIDPPEVSVTTSYRGASADIVETRVTQIIEDQLVGIDGVDYVTSTSRDGRSSINIVFKLSRDLDEAANDIRDAVSRTVAALPDDADPPVVQKADADSNPMMWLNLGSETINRSELTDFANRYIVPQFETIDGIAFVRAGGDQRPSIRIWLDRLTLAAHNLTALDVEQALRSQNVELPAGTVESQSRDFPVRIARSYIEPKDFEQLVVKETPDGRVVRIGDVATVERGPEVINRFFHGGGREMLGLGMVTQSNANQLEVAQRLHDKVAEIQKSLPRDMTLTNSYDSSVFIDASMREVWRTLAIALTLVILVIWAFLGNLRATVVPATVVPVCLIAAFTAIAGFDLSINLITLLALVLCIGLVVDDSIVVLENIVRRIHLGETPLVAAYRGARQVAFAVIATTIVLIAAFVSLALLEGFMGRIFRELAITISAAVAFSSLVALTLSPMLCSKLLKPEADSGPESRHLVQDAVERLGDMYEEALARIINKPVLVTLVVFMLIGLSVFILSQLPRDLAPAEDRGTAFMMFKFAEGAGYDHSRDRLLEAEKIMMEYVETGEAANVILLAPAFGQTTANSGIGFFIMSSWTERERNGFDIVDELRTRINNIPGV